MAEVITQISIERPVADVFGAFLEPDKLLRWRGGLERVEQLSGQRDQTGGKCRLHFSESGRDYELLEEIVTCRRNEEYVYRLVHHAMRFETQVTFTPRQTATSVRLHTRIRGRRLFWKLLLLFIRPVLRRQQEQDCQRLKNYCERPWNY